MEKKEGELENVSASDLGEEVLSEEAACIRRLAEGAAKLGDIPGPLCGEADSELGDCSTEWESKTGGQVDGPVGSGTSEGVGTGDVAQAATEWTGGVDEYAHPSGCSQSKQGINGGDMPGNVGTAAARPGTGRTTGSQGIAGQISQ